MTRSSRFVSDASSDGVEAVDNLQKGNPEDTIKQDDSGDSNEVVIVRWEGSVKALRAWPWEGCDTLWGNIGKSEESPVAPAEVDAHMEELQGSRST